MNNKKIGMVGSCFLFFFFYGGVCYGTSAYNTGEQSLEAGVEESVMAEGELEQNLPDNSENADMNYTVVTAETMAVRQSLLIDRLLDNDRCIGCDLAGADLAGKRLKGADLERVNLQGANLEGVNLSRANLKGADFSGANLKSANLSKADLYNAKFIDADLSGAKLDGALIDSADFTGAKGVEGILSPER